MKNGLYEMGDYVDTPDGKGYINEDQGKREKTVLVELISEDRKEVYDIEDIVLLKSI